jgi:hypothetical protein
MSKTTVKFTGKLPNPKIRKRDGQLMTRFISISLTDDEAVAIGEYFSKTKEEGNITTSLIRAFLIFQSLNTVDSDFLVEQMAALKVKTELANNLAYEDYIRALSLLKIHKEKKLAPKQEKVEVKKQKVLPKKSIRRVITPEVIVVRRSSAPK